MHGDTPGAAALTASMVDRAARRPVGLSPNRNVAVSWWSEADADARRAGMFGWMLDAFDVMLFALVLPR